jgi:predicted metal-dependent peptidase
MDKEKILDKAKIGIFMHSKAVFINSILFGLKFEWKEDIPTAQVDGETIFIQPDWFVNKINAEQRIGLLLHEAWHVGLEHHLRLGTRSVKYWTLACDHVINLMLVEDGFKIPPGGCLDYKFRGWSEERIYTYILEEEEEPPNQEGFGDDIVFPDSKEKLEELEEKVKQNILTASIQAKMVETDKEAGHIPGDQQRRLDAWLKPKLPWETILLNTVTERREEDYNWGIPNRRYYALGLILPSLDGEGIGKMHGYVDASGSVSQKQFSKYVAEFDQAVQLMNPREVLIAAFDTKLREPTILEDFDSLGSIKFTGGGGTCIKETLDHIAETKPDISVIFTDGHFTPYVPKGLHQDIIWVIDGNPYFTYEVGTIIHIETDKESTYVNFN